MNKTGKILVVVTLVVAVIGVISLNKRNCTTCSSSQIIDQRSVGGPTTQQSETVGHQAALLGGLPRLVDVGADQCIPCKLMAPMLGQLKKEYAGRFDVIFVDVWKNPDQARKYGVRMIPTQIFYDASGRELFRHEGFFSKENILSKWQELGVNLQEPALDNSQVK